MTGDAVDARRSLAFVPDTPMLFDSLSTLEHLLFVAELYRVDLDPGEKENLAGTSPDQVRVSTKALLRQRALAQEDAVAADSVALDEDVAAHLEAIGYMEH